MKKIDNGLEVAKKHGVERSSKWESFRKKFIQKNPACAVCGNTKNVEAHHVYPFHFCISLGRPELELCEDNLISLCDNEDHHHLLVGHLDNYKSYNLNVREDCEKYKNNTKEQIKENKQWLIEESNRGKLIEDMTDEDKINFKKMLDEKFSVKEYCNND